MLNPFIQRLMLMRQFSMDNAKITLLKQEQFLVDTDFISLVQEMHPKEFYDVVKKNAQEKVTAYTQVLGSSPENISEETLKSMFGTLGFGNVQIMQLNKEKQRVFLKLLDSPIVASYKKMKKKSKEPVCIFISAVLAGAFQAIFKKNVECKETDCTIIKGDGCHFIVE
ncbi:hypothetical protein C4573_03765 [Candidatus Woesearchaeota archaeon]|nr:MAG: hypothetical protein C4573_03765 [Candidatus Woesearchaeota archaeon]